MRNDEDGPQFEDYRDLDFQHLELDHLDLEPESESESSLAVGRWFILFTLIALVGFVIWFPNSNFYRMSPNGQTYFFVVSGLALLLGLVGGRWLWAWLEESALRYAEKAEKQEARPPRVISATERWLTLLAALGALIAVALLGNDQTGIPGQGASENWWLISLGALISASLGGRWLFIQANRPRKETPDSPPVELPNWFKWVTFSLLVGGGFFAVFGSTLMGGGPSIFDSSTFGAVGLVVGTLGAIWLSKRFDELEAHFKDSDRDK